MGFDCLTISGLMSLASMLLTGVIEEDTGADFYVAPDGEDSWSGQLPKPNASGDEIHERLPPDCIRVHV